MLRPMRVEHLSVYIEQPPSQVYTYASDPRNLPHWASGLAQSNISPAGDAWIADSPMGKVEIRFVADNSYGVLDHDVTLQSGLTVRNPMRVVGNGTGSELIFTLFQRPDMSDGEFTKDAATVAADLRTLKRILERGETAY